MVAFPALQPADIMQDGGALQPEAFLAAKLVQIGEQVKQAQGQAGDLLGMAGIHFARLRQV